MTQTHAGTPPRLTAAARIDLLLRLVAEIPAAILVVAEVVVLFAGVVARYALHTPLIWTDELASILFLWLAMLGAVIALQRSEHMRLTAVAGGLSSTGRARTDALAAAAVATFLLMIVPPAWDYASDQWYIQTPALSIHDTYRAVAILVGGVLMLITALTRLLALSWKDAAFGIVVVGALAAVLHFAAPWLLGFGNWNLVLFFVLLLGAAVLLSVPIGFAFGLATLAYLATLTRTPLTVVVSRMDEGMSSLILLAVPLFVFLGLLIEMTGMARAMVNFLSALLGHVRGGLSYVLLGAMYLVSGISGSKAADMAAVAPILFPDMKRRGFNEGELVSLLAASGAMSETIPPSLVLITIGSVTGVSIAALFTGGLVPAAVLAAALAFIARWRGRNENMEGVTRPPWAVIGKAFVISLPALVLPFVIRFAVIEGIATATEVSTIGIVYAIIVGILVYRQFPLRRLYPMLVETASLSGAILLIIGTATGMAWALTQSGFSHQLAAAMTSMPGGATGFMAVSIVAFIVLGSVLEGIPAIVLFGPLLFPSARLVGINEVHYAMVVILAMGIGLFAPPFGVGYYAACAIGRVSPDAAMRRIWPYLLAVLAGLIAVAAVPWFSTGFL
ncbi:TRAP transporter large permease subunit [Acidisphaera sp. S103]|uniref:TRAP transporter large permease n=1 Tax=Acidisphaera sp. S103 TaxID=1747223 RepID=UPI00131AAFBB|nr:TRAP transporter large permease subunit [Acidisphaera sp. S103]